MQCSLSYHMSWDTSLYGRDSLSSKARTPRRIEGSKRAPKWKRRSNRRKRMGVFFLRQMIPSTRTTFSEKHQVAPARKDASLKFKLWRIHCSELWRSIAMALSQEKCVIAIGITFAWTKLFRVVSTMPSTGHQHKTCPMGCAQGSSFWPLQLVPSEERVKPSRQLHLYEPWVLMQSFSQSCVPSAHSSMSEKETRFVFVDGVSFVESKWNKPKIKFFLETARNPFIPAHTVAEVPILVQRVSRFVTRTKISRRCVVAHVTASCVVVQTLVLVWNTICSCLWMLSQDWAHVCKTNFYSPPKEIPCKKHNKTCLLRQTKSTL